MQIWQCGLVFLLAAASYVLISRFVVQSVEVVGASMSPTLRDAERYFLNHCVYLVHSPRRGDIVVLKDPTDGTYAVKRIIAGPGESIHLKDGAVYLNGAELKEPYLPSGTPTRTASEKIHEEVIFCGRDQYFVLGDNRDDSFDSRYYGPVPRRNIMGAVIR
jgi:signal peptidase I